MDSNGWRNRWSGLKLATLAASSVVLGGCLQTAPVVVTPQDQQSRVVYSCPNAKSIDVTRLGNGTALVVVDGQTLQLARDTGATSSERYTNRLNTLTVYGGSATFETLGRTRYGPCTGSEYGVPGGDVRDGNRRRKMENTD